MGGQQGREIVLGRHGRQAGERVLQVGVRVVAVTLAGDEERVEDGGAVAGLRVSDEQPVLGAEFAGTDGVLDRVGVELGASVFEVRGQRRPVAEQVGAGLAELRAGCDRAVNSDPLRSMSIDPPSQETLCPISPYKLLRFGMMGQSVSAADSRKGGSN